MNIRKLNDKLQKFLIQEMAWKTSCGLELNEENTKDLVSKYELSFTPKSTDPLSRKIKWIIEYMDKVPRKNLIGLKISNVGEVEYILNNQRYKKSFVLYVNDTFTNSSKINTKYSSGLDHMKYGDSGHWEQSKRALIELPCVFKRCTFLEKSDKEFNYIKKAKGNKIFIIGIPKTENHECILVTCY